MNLVYHGSAEKIETVIPSVNIRMRNGKEIWNQVSFHATPHRWIALSYTRDKHAVETTGVSLYELEPVVGIYGPTTLEDALKNLYGKGGYLYTFNEKDFSHAEGLGTLERYTDKQLVPVREEWIEDPVAEMKREGIRFDFIRTDTPKE